MKKILGVLLTIAVIAALAFFVVIPTVRFGSDEAKLQRTVELFEQEGSNYTLNLENMNFEDLANGNVMITICNTYDYGKRIVNIEVAKSLLDFSFVSKDESFEMDTQYADKIFDHHLKDYLVKTYYPAFGERMEVMLSMLNLNDENPYEMTSRMIITSKGLPGQVVNQEYLITFNFSQEDFSLLSATPKLITSNPVIKPIADDKEFKRMFKDYELGDVTLYRYKNMLPGKLKVYYLKDDGLNVKEAEEILLYDKESMRYLTVEGSLKERVFENPETFTKSNLEKELYQLSVYSKREGELIDSDDILWINVIDQEKKDGNYEVTYDVLYGNNSLVNLDGNLSEARVFTSFHEENDTYRLDEAKILGHVFKLGNHKELLKGGSFFESHSVSMKCKLVNGFFYNQQEQNYGWYFAETLLEDDGVYAQKSSPDNRAAMHFAFYDFVGIDDYHSAYIMHPLDYVQGSEFKSAEIGKDYPFVFTGYKNGEIVEKYTYNRRVDDMKMFAMPFDFSDCDYVLLDISQAVNDEYLSYDYPTIIQVKANE